MTQKLLNTFPADSDAGPVWTGNIWCGSRWMDHPELLAPVRRRRSTAQCVDGNIQVYSGVWLWTVVDPNKTSGSGGSEQRTEQGLWGPGGGMRSTEQDEHAAVLLSVWRLSHRTGRWRRVQTVSEVLRHRDLLTGDFWSDIGNTVTSFTGFSEYYILSGVTAVVLLWWQPGSVQFSLCGVTAGSSQRVRLLL